MYNQYLKDGWADELTQEYGELTQLFRLFSARIALWLVDLAQKMLYLRLFNASFSWIGAMSLGINASEEMSVDHNEKIIQKWFVSISSIVYII